ncbi:MAG: hypothetical protein NTY53_03545 [Kiritimatiellaeota bacterium]|nr:hypothetical protein [Kiritimatiellota bacterium]
MGWGRYLLLGDLGQQLDLSDQKEEIAQLREELQRSRSAGAAPTGEIARLQAENDELRLYLAALVRLLVTKGVVTPGEIKQCVDAIDSADGARDGRYSGPIG